MSIEALIQAAEYLERREREAEHGYASLVPQHLQIDGPKHLKKYAPSRRVPGSRSTHNELEKNRRAHLRVCLERLREQVPPGPDVSRHTTLGLLTRARDYIRSLEDKDRMNLRYKDQLRRQQRQLSGKLQTGQLDRRRLQLAAGKLRSSDSVSSGVSVSSSGSSSYSTSELSEAADSPDSDIRSAAVAGLRRTPLVARRTMATAMSQEEDLAMQKLYPHMRTSWFGSPGQDASWEETKKIWVIVEVYPLFAAIALGCGICFAHCMRHLFFSPDVFMSKGNRSNAMIDNFKEGAGWQHNPLRQMASLKKDKTDPFR